jgi:predicted enzyme related to lactoylglutathione lyase
MDVFAGLPVANFKAALPWYEQLFGEPSFLPHDSEAVWTLGEHRHVYIVEKPEDAGHGLATLFTEDLESTLEAIAARGLEPSDNETYANGVRKATFRDPDGNEIGLGGHPR